MVRAASSPLFVKKTRRWFDSRSREEIRRQLEHGRVEAVTKALQSPGLGSGQTVAVVQHLGHECAEELVAARSVRVGQGGAGHAGETQTLAESGQVFPERDQVAKAGDTPEMSEQEDVEMVAGVEGASAAVHSEVVDRILDHGVRNLPHQLEEERGSLAHGLGLPVAEVEGC